MKKNYLGLQTFLIIFIGIFAVIQVFLLNSYSTKGSELSGMQIEIEQYKKENDMLINEIASYSAMINLSKIAENTGFIKSNNAISLASPLPMAYSMGTSY